MTSKDIPANGLVKITSLVLFKSQLRTALSLCRLVHKYRKLTPEKKVKVRYLLKQRVFVTRFDWVIIVAKTFAFIYGSYFEIFGKSKGINN